MIKYEEVKTERVLNPTSIDLGEYVINPYRGCAYGCLYCYVRSNKSSLCAPRAWGSYVDARINTSEQLEKELLSQRPACVLLGSTTECFQPAEKKYGLTEQVLRILNKHKIDYVILTRSPLIQEYSFLLEAGFCKAVYFTVNDFIPALKTVLEPASPSFESRFQAIEKLSKNGVSVIPYICPVLPGITDIARFFDIFSEMNVINFEGLNFNLKNIKDIIAAIGMVYPRLEEDYRKMLVERTFYEKIWQDARLNMLSRAHQAGKDGRVFIHAFGVYFNNSYVQTIK